MNNTDLPPVPRAGESGPQVCTTIRLYLAILDDLSPEQVNQDRKSTRLNSSHQIISYAVFCLKKKKAIDIYVDKIVCGMCQYMASMGLRRKVDALRYSAEEDVEMRCCIVHSEPMTPQRDIATD